ncbi:uncharacterized protein LOC129809142 [Phlebotomus papatasi]|uniref:uncharacterized protein LOC129809142 n=1 Tax=Phlebotomus papatasi TaxID=29031 RepID=UPI0024841350|nr:uncharacterized protein LOC129809142 [Phlebotomus papatasi]XP_055714926.1 uncharacterized protein LOC129809142 [Phlebotomus papatasi]
MFDKGSISYAEKRSMTIYNAISPRIYGLPKIHKQGIPLRPVVSFVGSPTYNLAKFISANLSPLSQSHYNVKNSLEIAEFVVESRLPEGYVLISLDVVSLFTNVPIDIALKEIERRFHEIGPNTDLQKEDFLTLTKFCLTTGYFTYNGTVYSQLKGVAMGSPISPIVADIVMQKALDSIMENSHLRIGFIKKYVDDLLLSIHQDDVDTVLEAFNGFHPAIQFTMEQEVDRSLPYLDMKIHRDTENNLRTTWYAKPYTSQRILNYNSGHPLNMIINVGKNLAKRVRSLTTESQNSTDTTKTIFTILRKNDFPPRVIRRILAADSSASRTVNSQPAVISEPFQSLGYIPGVSEKMKKRIKQSTEQRISFRPLERIGKFFSRLKDPVPIELQSGVVYEVPCKDCHLKYIGTTGQLLKNRLQQHKRDCKPPIVNTLVSTLCTHTAETGHSFDFDATRILDRHNIYSKRMMLEALHIRKNINTVCNKRDDISCLNAIYAGLPDP